jgi:hypothetical protein
LKLLIDEAARQRDSEEASEYLHKFLLKIELILAENCS